MDHRTTQAPDQSSVTPAWWNASPAQLLKMVARYEAAMKHVVDELEEDFDITDNGGPNKAMRLAHELEEAIYGPGGY